MAVEKWPVGSGKGIKGSGFAAGAARLAILPEATARELGDFVRASVKPGSRLDSDAFKSYAKLGDTYRHQPVVQGQGKNAEQLMPVVHVLFSNVKTWLNGNLPRGERQAFAALRPGMELPLQPAQTHLRPCRFRVARAP